MTTQLQLVNLTNHQPFFTQRSTGLKIEVYTAQNIYIGEKYIARKFEYFEKSGSAVLYFVTTINSVSKDFVFSIPQLDKRFIKEWTKEQWIELVYLLHRKDKVQTDLEDVKAAIMSMKPFSDIRKLAKKKKTELKKEIKSVDRTIQQFLVDAREKGNESILFRD